MTMIQKAAAGGLCRIKGRSETVEILGITEDNCIKMNMPQTPGRSDRPELARTYRFIFETANGTYEADGVVTERYHAEGQARMIVRLTSPYYQI